MIGILFLSLAANIFSADFGGFNSTNHNGNCTVGEVVSSEYPLFAYQDAEGNILVFPTLVAWLNVAGGPLIETGSYCALHWLQLYLEKSIEAKLNQRYASLLNAEKRFEKHLIQTILKFPNDLNIENTSHKMAVHAALSQLRCFPCEKSLKDFIEIVCKKSPDGTSQKKRIKKLYKCMEENYDDPAQSPIEITQAPINYDLDDEDIDDESGCMAFCKKSMKKVGNFLCWCTPTWINPFHPASLAVMTCGYGMAAITTAFGLNDQARAGCVVGDYANVLNTFFIPISPLSAIVRQLIDSFLNRDENLNKRITKEFERTEVTLEIAARVIGEMDNGINCSEARGCYKVLILLNWPQDLVTLFENLAAEKNSDKVAFAKELRRRVHDEKISYRDDDIKNAFSLRDTEQDNSEDDSESEDDAQASDEELKKGKEKVGPLKEAKSDTPSAKASHNSSETTDDDEAHELKTISGRDDFATLDSSLEFMVSEDGERDLEKGIN